MELITFESFKDARDFVSRCPRPCKIWDLGGHYLVEWRA